MPASAVASDTLAALADDTRMGIVEALAARDHTVGELVDLFPISQPAISRHLRVLREAGVVASEAHGKLRVYRLNPAALHDVTDWTDRCRRTWEARFDALGDHLDRMKEQRRAR
ncbi:MAG TPA: metalloregulator ArsR/SmtB family transcription factor [Acidimicrobiales bacterium]|nr:metalloregulator ArsR/SmtB family transcription factor [Acidimicrobiales bacterium]